MRQNPRQLVLPAMDDCYRSAHDRSMEEKSPLPMQYLGAKTRIAKQLLERISYEFPKTRILVDLFAGTGVVSLTADRFGYRVIANDLQRYAYVVLSSLLCHPRAEAGQLSKDLLLVGQENSLLADGRSAFENELRLEREFVSAYNRRALNWEEYMLFCENTNVISGGADEVAVLRAADAWNLFSHYYRNTYFGVEQCLQLDTLRQWAETLEEPGKTHVLASMISAMTYAVSGTTHFAQYSKVRSERSAYAVLRRRSIDLVESVRNRLLALSQTSTNNPAIAVHNEDFAVALEKTHLNEETVAYADPPYFKEHYSRYYHVLDTLVLYDYPELTQNARTGHTTVGRYRANRLVSNFGRRSSVREAFAELLHACREHRARVAISYADTSLLGPAELLDICSSSGWRARVFEFALMHSGQGQPRNKDVTEQLFLLTPK